MQPITLEQKTGFDRKKFVLEEDVLRIQTKKMGEKWDFAVRYDQIGFETMRKTDLKNRWAPHALAPFLLVYIALIVNTIRSAEPNMVAQLVILIGCLILFGTGFVLALIGRKKEYIYLTGGTKTIELFANKPDTATVEGFIEQVYLQVRNLQKTKYEEAQSEFMPYELHEQWLNYLVEIKAITKEEKLKKLEELKKAGSSPIGFQMSGN